MPDRCSCKIAGWLLMHRCKHRSSLLQTPPQTLHVHGVVIILTGQRQPWVLSASALVVTLSGAGEACSKLVVRCLVPVCCRSWWLHCLPLGQAVEV